MIGGGVRSNCFGWFGASWIRVGLSFGRVHSLAYIIHGVDEQGVASPLFKQQHLNLSW